MLIDPRSLFRAPNSGLIPIALLVIVTVLAALSGVAIAQSPSEYTASADITITNNSSSTDVFGPVPASINADNLELGGFVDFTTEDTLFTDSSNLKTGGIAQDTGDNGAIWWWFADVGQEQTGIVKLFMNGPTTTHMMPLGQDARVEVPYDASLDITDNLTIEATVNAAALFTGASSTVIVEKQLVYGLGLRAAGEVYGYIQNATATITVRPDGDGDYTNLSRVGCTLYNNQCVDDPIPDEDLTYLTTASGSFVKDAFTLFDDPLADGHVVNSVTVHWRARHNSTVADTQPHLRLNGVETSGSIQVLTNFYQNFSETLARPGGGNWSLQDIDDLQVVMGGRAIAGSPVITQVYIVLDYGDRAEVSYTGVTAKTNHTLKLAFVNPDLQLYLDDVLVASTTASGVTGTNTLPVTVGGDTDGDNGWFAGGIGDVKIGDTSTTTPTWKLLLDFQPVDIYQTQAGSTSNAWLFTGTIADESPSANNAVYYITRDMTNLEIDVAGLVLDVSAPSDFVIQPPPDIIGDTPIDVFLTPQPTITGEGSSLFIDPIIDAAENSGMPRQAWFILFTTFVAAPLTARAFKVFPSWVSAAVLAGIIYAIVVFTFGLTTWFLAFDGIWMASVIAVNQYMKA